MSPTLPLRLCRELLTEAEPKGLGVSGCLVCLGRISYTSPVKIENDAAVKTEEGGKKLRAQHLAGIAVVASVLRLCNLGTFSLWLDEVLITQRAQGSLRETWVACQANAEHPPLSALVMSACHSLGFSDDLQRLVPIVLGVATLVLLAHWAAAHFGRPVGLLAGFLGALSPLHLRYSQELRPYSYLLFFAVLTLVLVDRLAQRPGWRSILLCAAALAGGLYTHIQFPLVLIPASLVLLESRRGDTQARGRLRRLAGLGAAAALAMLAFLPWLETITRLAQRTSAGGAASWTWYSAGQRWQFLSLAAREGDGLTWGGTLMAVLVILGAASVWRQCSGRAVLLAALVGTVGVELALLGANHWSNGRYNLMAWPFLLILTAAGCDLLRTLGRRPIAGVVIGLAVVGAHLQAIGDYQRIGRPSWDRMAEVIRLVRRADEKVFTENLPGRISLGYYLDRRTAAPRTDPITVDGDISRLARLWPPDRSCLLVIGRHPASPRLRRLAARFPMLVEYYSTGSLYRLTPEIRSKLFAGDFPEIRHGVSRQWPSPSIVALPKGLRGQPATCPERLWRAIAGESKPAQTRRLDFDPETTAEALLGGWSGFEATDDGHTFVWATGHETAIMLHCQNRGPYYLTLRLRAYPFAGETQRMRGFLNGGLLGETTLRPETHTITVPLSANRVSPGENLLVLQFAHTPAQANARPGSRETRALAAAFDWLELKDTAEPD